ncbi:uncharacterized protein LOC127878722 [Dreissena polymorpha]|uniref:uncharacterized protein LOC127878722 n=1 Tax=Dreissena polymorpha TaxID=45954 RepID=UPI0022654557|nr:uncharacterized protein LOC127878722 [Dreissena polymorpha]
MSRSQNKTTAAFTFDNFNIWPMPILVPGTVHLSADLTVNRPVHSLYMDEDVDEAIESFFFKLPCMGQGIGSCSDIDCCEYRTIEMPEIWERFMFYLLGNESYCPIPSKSVVIQDELISIPSVPGPLVLLGNKMYTIKLFFKESRDAKDHFGCIEFDLEYDLDLRSSRPVG